MFTDSLGFGLDPYALEPSYIDGKISYERKHSENHLDCLVGTNAHNPSNFEKDSLEYINKIRPLDIATIYGLDTAKLLGKEWVLDPKPQ